MFLLFKEIRANAGGCACPVSLVPCWLNIFLTPFDSRPHPEHICFFPYVSAFSFLASVTQVQDQCSRQTLGHGAAVSPEAGVFPAKVCSLC